MHFQNPKYRLTYEAFSKYSSKLAMVGSFEELNDVTSLSLKYFFDFHQLRVHILKKDVSKTIMFFSNSYLLATQNSAIYSFEKDLKRTKIPIYREIENSDLQMNDIPFDISSCEHPKLWGWYFEYANVKVCLSLVSDDRNRFGIEDLDILRLFVETYSGKYQQLMLRSQLEEKNRNLEKALREVEEKTEEIHSIIARQKEIIRKRTKSIEEKNLMLLELITVNSHNVREPLTRILGLLEICNTSDPKEITETILPFLKQSAEDLDNTIKSTIMKSSGVISERRPD